MKKVKAIIFVFCAILFLSSTQGFAQVAKVGSRVRYVEEEIIPKREFANGHNIECGYVKPIRVAGFVTNPPFGWMDLIPATGLLPDRYINDGFAYLLFKKLAGDMGLQVQGVGYKSYYEALNALKKGKIDVLLGSYYDKRTLGVGTSIMFPGYFANPIIPVFLKGHEKEVKTLDDLKGLKGVVRQEELLYSMLYEQIPEDVVIEQVSGARKAFSMLLTGQVDFMITSLYAAEAEIRRFKITDKVTLSKTPLMTPELFFVFGSSSPCKPLKKLFSDQLKAERKNMSNINRLLFAQIDRWIDRFRYEMPLTDSLQMPAQVVVQPQ